jgi:hypothetical protein
LFAAGVLERLDAAHVRPGIDFRHNLAQRTGAGAGIARAANGDEKTLCPIGQRNVHALGVGAIARAHPEVRHHADDLAPLCRLV